MQQYLLHMSKLVGREWPCLFFVFGMTKLMHAQYSNIVYALD